MTGNFVWSPPRIRLWLYLRAVLKKYICKTHCVENVCVIDSKKLFILKRQNSWPNILVFSVIFNENCGAIKFLFNSRSERFTVRHHGKQTPSSTNSYFESQTPGWGRGGRGRRRQRRGRRRQRPGRPQPSGPPSRRSARPDRPITGFGTIGKVSEPGRKTAGSRTKNQELGPEQKTHTCHR